MAVPTTETSQRYDLQSLYETSRLLSSSLDLRFVLSNLLLTTMSKLLVMRGAAVMYDPVSSSYTVVSCKGIPGLKEGRTISVGAEARTGCNSVPMLERRGLRLFLSIEFSGKHLGLIGLGPKATGLDFAPAELEFVRSLVNMSASAVNNCQLVDELQQANRDLDGKVQQLNTLFELSKEFDAAIGADQLIKLFSFALMGQMLVGRHAFFLGTQGSNSQSGDHLRQMSVSGFNRSLFATDVLAFLAQQKQLVLLGPGRSVPEPVVVLRDHGMALILPLVQQQEVVGIICLGAKGNKQPYTPSDIEFLYALGNLAVVSLQNAELVEQRIEKERLEEELKMAREIQLGLLPGQLPIFRGIRLATMALPSLKVGGDYFDVVELANGKVLFVIADVTGKGMPAALLMANMQACIHMTVPLADPIEVRMRNLNRVIHRNTAADKFITAFCGIYDLTTCRLDYVNAGHESPIVLRKTGDALRLHSGGLLLGVLPDVSYVSGTIALEDGDVLVMFTDGVTEAMGAAKVEYTDARLAGRIASLRDLSAEHILEAIQADVESFTGPVETLSDDRTMVVMKVASMTA